MSILFDSIDDNVQIANPSNFHFADGTDFAFSISAWIKMNDRESFAIVTKGPDANREWRFGTRGGVNTGILIMTLNGLSVGTDITRNADSPLLNDIWYHVGFTYNGDGTFNGMKLYVNGNIFASTGTEGTTYDRMRDSGANVKIGEWTDIDNADGQITEMAFWRAELTASEMLALFNTKNKKEPLNIRAANLVSYWPMNDGDDGISADGETIEDLSGNSNDGTGNNGANNTGLIWKAEEVLTQSSLIHKKYW